MPKFSLNAFIALTIFFLMLSVPLIGYSFYMVFGSNSAIWAMIGVIYIISFPQHVTNLLDMLEERRQKVGLPDQ